MFIKKLYDVTKGQDKIVEKANEFEITLNKWVQQHLIGVVCLNLILMLLILLRSAGYFAPYLYISINIIVFISLVLVYLLLGGNNKVFFTFSLVFILFAAFLKLFEMDVWAERTIVYSFEAFVVGFVIFFKELIKK